MALLLLKENISAKLFLNPRINVEVMAPDKLNLWPFYHLSFKSDLELQPTQAKVSNDTTTPQGENLCQTILKSIHKCRSYGLDKRMYDHFIIWPSSVTLTFNLPKKVSNDTTPPQEQKLC